MFKALANLINVVNFKSTRPFSILLTVADVKTGTVKGKIIYGLIMFHS